MKAKPYVGVTGSANIQETKKICREFIQAGFSIESLHIPMIGLLVSYNTLNGQSTKNKRYPPIKVLPELLKATKGKVLTSIHYYTQETDSLPEQVEVLFKGIYEEGLCRIIQLNISCSNIIHVATIKEEYPNMQIILPVSNDCSKKVAERVVGYRDLVDYVLIDPSKGRGKIFDLESSIATYCEIKKYCPNLTIGFAGGFTGENVASRLKEIIQKIETNEFCIDAEGGLRDKSRCMDKNDVLNTAKVKSYLESAYAVLEQPLF